MSSKSTLRERFGDGDIGGHNLAMTDASIRPFDAGALYQALDVKRTELGLSWKGVADQIWALSSDLNNRRRDHPISPSTLTNMAKKPRTSCQHALFMLRWLGRSPESFLHGAVGDDPRYALPRVGSDRRLRWALKLLYAAMDDKRREDGLDLARARHGARMHSRSAHRLAHGEVRHRDGGGHAHRAVDRTARGRLVYPATW